MILFLGIVTYVVSPSFFSIITEAGSRPIEAIECNNNNNFNINNAQGSSSINNEDNTDHIESKDGSIVDSGTLEKEFVNNNIGLCENFNSNELTAVKDEEGDTVFGGNDGNGIDHHQASIDISNNYITNKQENCHTISNQDQTDINNDNSGNICDFTPNNLPLLYAQATLPDFNFAAVGDWGNGVNAQNTINNIKSGNPELVLGLGDYAYESNLADITSWWNRFISAGLAQKWYGALGNHDDDMSPTGDMNEYQNKFPNQNSWSFSFDYQNIHFLVIDTESTYTIGSPQYNFIKADLSTANSNSNIKWKVVIFHHLMYSSNSSHSPTSSLRDALHPLFDQYKVDMVIQAHNHYYQRMFPLKYAGISGGDSPIITTSNTTNYKNPDGQIYLVVGTGGQALYTPGLAKLYTVTQIQDFGHLNIDVVENGTKLVGKFLNNAGTLKDTFTITKPNIISSPPVPTLETCNNGIDDDGDGKIDAEDVNSCPAVPEICNNGLDDDRDGLKDAADQNCQTSTGYHYEPFLDVNDLGDVVTIPDEEKLKLTKFSVAAWFKTTSNFEKIAMIVNKGGIGSDSFGNNMNYGLWMTSSEQIQGGLETSGGTDRMVTSPNSYNNGQWHHGVVTFDGSILRLYVDGVQITTLSTSSIPETAGINPLKIGANSRIADNLFTGSIDEVGVWNRALTTTEITNLKNNGIFVSSGLVYSNSFGISPPSSSSGYHYDPFLDVNDLGDVVTIPDEEKLKLTKFSVAAWFKTTSNFEKIAMIVNKGGIGSDSFGNNMNYGLWMTSSEQIQGGLETSGGTDRMVTSPNSYNNGQWHHGVVTFDGSILRLYIDGVQITTLSTSSIPETAGINPLKIGANSRIADNLFTGSIDEVGVWNRALTTTEITTLMNTSIFPSDGLVYGNSFSTSVIRNDLGIDVGTFFYPWYGKYRHWIDDGHNPPNTWASNYLPSLYNSQYPNIISDNLYNSNDTNTIKKQIQLMNDTGIEFGIASWWGQNTYEDRVFDKIINDVQPTMNGYNKFRWAILYEDEGFGDPSLTEIINDLNYIKKNYASSPYYLHVNGKPVIFVYNAAHSGADPLDDLERWKQAKTQVPFYVVFKVDPLSRGANPNDMDSWYQYAPASKYFEQQKTFSAFVSPGFWKYHENVRLPAASPLAFETAVNNLKQAQVTWKLVETWNEWGEGTGIEPAQQIIHDDTNGFQLVTNPTPSQQYLEIFKRYFK